MRVILFQCLFVCLTFFSSCHGQSETITSTSETAATGELFPYFNAQIGTYLVKIFEDSKGNLWIGTLSKGVARYDGAKLRYFTTADGLAGNAVVNIIEDKEGNLWFGTHSGLSKYDGNAFTNFRRPEGDAHNRISNLLIDSRGVFWVGTWMGACQFNGNNFVDFPLPKPDVELYPYQTTMNWITEIMEDRDGNIWFGRDGYGACIYDGEHFRHLTKVDGLPSNNVQGILEDRSGNLWFGTRVAERDQPSPEQRNGTGGLSRYDGETFTQYPDLEGLHNNDVYSIYEDHSGNIWISATGIGLYVYDGESFRIHQKTNRMDIIPKFTVQGMLQDSKGVLWLGCNGGLFRFEGPSIVNVTQGGPWK